MSSIPYWHKVGFPINAKTIEEVLDQANLTWKVSKRPILTTKALPTFTANSINPDLLNSNGTHKTFVLRQKIKALIDDPTNPSLIEEIKNLLESTKDVFLPVKTEFVVVRDDINAIFSTVGNNYTTIDNKDCIDVLQCLMDEKALEVRRAGTFMNGANVWVICQLPKTLEIGNEKIDQYIRVGWSHDGSEKLTARFLNITHNGTILSPELQGVKVEISIRHTKNAHARIMSSKEILAGHQKYTEKFLEKSQMMLLEHVTIEDVLKALFTQYGKEKILKSGKIGITRDQKVSESIKRRIASLDLSVASTAWGTYRAICDFADHEKGVRLCGEKKGTESEENEARLRSNMSAAGSSLLLKQKAWNYLSTPVSLLSKV